MSRAIEPGTTIDHLVIERELGRGAFANVYLAHDTRLERHVALKLLAGSAVPDVDSRTLDRFLSEARVVAGFNSPHIVTLYRLHERPDGAWLLEMEYMPGGTLTEQIRRGLPLAQAEAILRDIVSGLGVAHEAGVLHRDVKPGNVLLARDGTPKLTDFGLARMIGDDALLDDGLVGTPRYMAPEVLLGEGSSAQSDLWSVGVVAYEMLAGHLPFNARDAAEFFASVQNAPPAPLPPAAGAHLQEAIASCLAKEADARPASCGALLEVLDHSIGVAVPPLPAPRDERRFLGRREEVARIDAALAAAGDEAGTLLLVGRAGIGKSMVAAEAARRARAAGFAVVEAKLSAAEGPLATLLHAAHAESLRVSTSGSVGSGTGRQVLRQLLRGEGGPDLQDRQQVLWVLENLLGDLAAELPPALLVDDAQHATSEDVALLSDLVRQFSRRPFLMLLATRPGSPATADFRADERIELGGLAEETLYALLEDRMDAPLPPEVVRRIAERSAGQPLLAIELTRHLAAAGAIARTDDRFELGTGWDEDRVPERLRDVVNARLRKLDEEDRTLLEVAAVDGRAFDGAAVAAVLDLPTLQVLRRLQRLCRDRTLLAPGDPGYCFADLPLQEVLYEDLAPEFRVELHRAYAQHLEGRAEPVAPARLARHWEGCGARDQATPYLIEMATAASRPHDMARAVELGRRAGLLEDPAPVDLNEHAELALSLASALAHRGGAEEAQGLLERLQAASDAGASPLQALAIEVRCLDLEVRSLGRLDVDEERLRTATRELAGTAEAGTAQIVLGFLAKRSGDLDRARAAYLAADAVFEGLGDITRRSRTQDQLGSVALRAGRYDESQRYYHEAANLSDRAGLRASAAVSRANRAAAALSGGILEGLTEDLERALRTFELSGNWLHAGQARLFLAETQYALGETADALRQVDRGIEAIDLAKQRYAAAYAYRLRGTLRAVQGELEAADADVTTALEHGTAAGDPAQIATAHAALALVATWSGQEARAREAATEALRQARETDQSLDEVVSLLAEAGLFGLPRDLLSAAGEVRCGDSGDSARALLAAALAFLSGDAPALAKHAQELLEVPVGARRCHARLLARWMVAEAALRAGDEAQAERERAAALEAAARIGHVWVSRALARPGR
ncbi:MAG: serine/threonine-protein kinase [Planctomycetota bacterium]